MTPAHERELVRRIETLEETVRQLTVALRPPQLWPIWMPRLTGREEAVLSLLVSRPAVTRDMFEIAVAPNSVEPHKLLDSFIFKLRTKLSTLGIEIESIRGVGYRLAPHSRDYLKAAVSEAQELAAAA